MEHSLEALPVKPRRPTGYIKILNLPPFTRESDTKIILQKPEFGLALAVEGFHVAGEAGINVIAVMRNGSIDKAALVREFESYRSIRAKALGLRESDYSRISVRSVSDWEEQTKKLERREKSCLVVLTCVPLSPKQGAFPENKIPHLDAVLRRELREKRQVSVKSVWMMPEGKRRRSREGISPYANKTRAITIEMFSSEHADLILKPERVFDCFIHEELGDYAFYALQKQAKQQLYKGKPGQAKANIGSKQAVVRITHIAHHATFQEIAAFLRGRAHLPPDTVSQRNLTMTDEGLQMVVHVWRKTDWSDRDTYILQDTMRTDKPEFQTVFAQQLRLEDAPHQPDESDWRTAEVQFVVRPPGAAVEDISHLVVEEVQKVLAGSGVAAGGLPYPAPSRGTVHTIYFPLATPRDGLTVVGVPSHQPLLDAHTLHLTDGRSVIITATRLVPDPTVPGTLPDLSLFQADLISHDTGSAYSSNPSPMGSMTGAPLPPQAHRTASQEVLLQAGGRDAQPLNPEDCEPATAELLHTIYEEMGLMGMQRIDFKAGRQPLQLQALCRYLEEHRGCTPAQRARAMMEGVALLEEDSAAREGVPLLSREERMEKGQAAQQLDPSSPSAHLVMAGAAEDEYHGVALRQRAGELLLAMCRSDAPGEVLEAARILCSLRDMPCADPLAETRDIATSFFCPSPAGEAQTRLSRRPILLRDSLGVAHRVSPLELYQSVAASPRSTVHHRYITYLVMGRMAESAGHPMCLVPYNLESAKEALQFYRLAARQERLPAARHHLRECLEQEQQQFAAVRVAGSRFEAPSLGQQVDTALEGYSQRVGAMELCDSWKRPPRTPSPPPLPRFAGLGAEDRMLLLAREMWDAGAEETEGGVPSGQVCQQLYLTRAAPAGHRAEALCLLMQAARREGLQSVSIDDDDVEGTKPIHQVAKEAVTLDERSPHALDELALVIAARDAAQGSGKSGLFLKLALRGEPSRKWYAADLRTASDELLLSLSESEDPGDLLHAAREVARRLQGRPGDGLGLSCTEQRLRVLPLLQQALAATRESGLPELEYRVLLSLGQHVSATGEDVLLEGDSCPAWKVYSAAIGVCPDMPAAYMLLANCFADESAKVGVPSGSGDERTLSIAEVREEGASRLSELAVDVDPQEELSA